MIIKIFNYFIIAILFFFKIGKGTAEPRTRKLTRERPER
jgi:hypothetical protein